ncbi:hypothetical protein EOM82_09415 [bacterium]|nr:hypothetical protein [bacterium]
MDENNAKALLAAIFNQAIYDYQKCLNIQKRTDLSPEKQEQLAKEINSNEEFFRGDWAKEIAETLNIAFSPEKLIAKLKQEAE